MSWKSYELGIMSLELGIMTCSQARHFPWISYFLRIMIVIIIDCIVFSYIFY